MEYTKIDGKYVINDMSIDQLIKYIESINEKPFHAKQIYKWLHRLNVETFDEMTDISKSLREKLKESCMIYTLKIIEKQESKDKTIKFLIELYDNNAIETVLMRYSYGNTVCVSTEIGCKMGCKFCASTGISFERKLYAFEIEGQILAVEKYLGEKISNVVYMGIGEPLDNYENTVKSIRIINHNMGLNIGARHISISTCGLVDEIKRLADENIQCTLSISLHEVDDKKRQEIMPIAKKYTIKQLLDSSSYYIMKTGRRISFEYALINNVNDDEKTAYKLAKLIKDAKLIAHINLIPINELETEKKYKKSNNSNIEKFMNILNKNNIVATVRRELGSDIDAACGQLRRKKLKK